MTEKAKTILIGCFIIIACLSTIGVLLFLRPTVGDGEKKLFVCFTSIEKIQIGTRVTFAGKPIGEVVGIDQIYDARSQPTGRHGHVCFYELELAVDSHTVVYDTDEITIHTTGLMGERTIAIIPKAVKKGQPSYPITDQIMYGKSGDPIEETLNQIISIGSKAGEAIDQLKDILEQNKSEIPLTLKSLKDAATQIKTSFETMNSSHLFLHANETILSMQDTFKHAGKIVRSWDENDIGTSLPDAMKNIAAAASSLDNNGRLREFSNNITEVSLELRNNMPNLRDTLSNFKNFSDSMSPTGSFGRLFKNDEFYLQLTALMGKLNVTLDDVNNYGVLFHLDKSWQRERLKRINLLNQLCRPQDFNNYFQEEIDRINLSLNRIAKTMQKANCSCNRRAILCDKDFKDGFSELLQRLGDVTNNLQIYRQEFIESRLNENCCPPIHDNCCPPPFLRSCSY